MSDEARLLEEARAGSLSAFEELIDSTKKSTITACV